MKRFLTFAVLFLMAGLGFAQPVTPPKPLVMTYTGYIDAPYPNVVRVDRVNQHPIWVADTNGNLTFGTTPTHDVITYDPIYGLFGNILNTNGNGTAVAQGQVAGAIGWVQGLGWVFNANDQSNVVGKGFILPVNNLILGTNNVAIGLPLKFPDATIQSTAGTSSSSVTNIIGALGMPKIGTNAFIFQAFPRKTNNVWVAPYFQAIQGAANFGPTHNETSFEMINTNNPTRIRQTGNVVGATLYVPSTNGLTNLVVELWKLNGTNYDKFGTSSSLWPIVPAATNTFIFTTALSNVVEGDFYGFYAQFSAATAQNFFATNGAGTYGATTVAQAAGGLSITNVQMGATNAPWATNLAQTVTVPIQLLMQAPQMVAFGASLTEGQIGTKSFADIGPPTANPQIAWPSVFAKGLGVTYQNMGQSGDAIDKPDNIAIPGFRFTNDCLNLFPAFAVDGGDCMRNAIYAARVTNSVLLGYFTNELYSCISNGIPLVMCTTMPTIAASGMNSILASNMDYCDNVLLSMATNWPNNLVVVDFRPTMGITCSTAGPPANLWTLNPYYDSGDGVHPHAPGWRVAADTVSAVVTPMQVAGKLAVGGINVKSGNITFDGNSGSQGVGANFIGGGQYIDFGRQQQYMQPGFYSLLSAQGAYLGSTNQAGGILELRSGVSTGSNTSYIQFEVPAPGPIGSQDNTNVVVSTVVNDLVRTAWQLFGRGSTNPINVEFYTNDVNGNSSYIGAVGADKNAFIGLKPQSSSTTVRLGLDNSGNPMSLTTFAVGQATAPANKDQLAVVLPGTNGTGGMYIAGNATNGMDYAFATNGSTLQGGFGWTNDSVIGPVLTFWVGSSQAKRWITIDTNGTTRIGNNTITSNSVSTATADTDIGIDSIFSATGAGWSAGQWDSFTEKGAASGNIGASGSDGALRKYLSAPATGNTNGIYGANNWTYSRLQLITMRIQTASTNSLYLFSGVSDSTLTNGSIIGYSNNAVAVNAIGVEFNSALGDTNWMLCTRDGVHAPVRTKFVNTPIDTGKTHEIALVVNVAASNVVAYIDGGYGLGLGTPVATNSSTLPQYTSSLAKVFGDYDGTAATNNTIYCQYLRTRTTH